MSRRVYSGLDRRLIENGEDNQHREQRNGAERANGTPVQWGKRLRARLLKWLRLWLSAGTPSAYGLQAFL
jgi:hypothetical protein